MADTLPGQDVIDLGRPALGDNTMAKECCETETCQFAKLYEFQLASLMDSSRHGSTRLREVNDFISTQTQVNHLQEGTKVGTREAAAMQRMDQDKSANKAMEIATAAMTQAGRATA